ncbi:hypothetical protein ACJX0J_024500, partial [Zea mays]
MKGYAGKGINQIDGLLIQLGGWMHCIEGIQQFKIISFLVAVSLIKSPGVLQAANYTFKNGQALTLIQKVFKHILCAKRKRRLRAATTIPAQEKQLQRKIEIAVLLLKRIKK